MLEDYVRANEYNSVYHHWKQLRDSTGSKQGSPLKPNQRPAPIEDVIKQFFEMASPIRPDNVNLTPS